MYEVSKFPLPFIQESQRPSCVVWNETAGGMYYCTKYLYSYLIMDESSAIIVHVIIHGMCKTGVYNTTPPLDCTYNPTSGVFSNYFGHYREVNIVLLYY